MMGTRERVVGATEFDALFRHKKFFRWRPGARRLIKAKFWRRVRRQSGLLTKGEHDERS